MSNKYISFRKLDTGNLPTILLNGENSDILTVLEFFAEKIEEVEAEVHTLKFPLE